jgi:hypothetical protein
LVPGFEIIYLVQSIGMGFQASMYYAALTSFGSLTRVPQTNRTGMKWFMIGVGNKI